MTINDAGGASASASTTLNVQDASIFLTAHPIDTSTAGTPLTNVCVATLTDNDPFADAGDYTGTIDWGDGTIDTGASVTFTPVVGNPQAFQVSGSHTYTTGAYYTIATQVVDHPARAQAAIRIIINWSPSSLTGDTTTTLPDVDPVFEPNSPSDSPALTGPGPSLVSLGEADVEPDSGGLRLRHDLDFDLSPGTGVAAHPALVYNSDMVSVRPIVRVLYRTDPLGLLPSTLDFGFTWNNVFQGTYTFDSQTGHNPGDTYLLGVQVNNPVSTTGVYPYTVRVRRAGSQDLTFTSTYLVVANDSSPFGAGWYLDGLDRLVVVNASGTVPAGLLWVYGTGGARFWTKNADGTYQPPADDFGTLSASNGYVYTALDHTQKYFDSAGRLTRVVEPHGLTLTYAYDGSGRLTQVSSPDGGLTTFSYDGSNHLSKIQEPGGRTVTVTVDGPTGHLTGLADPNATSRAFGYDSGHRLTSDNWSPLTPTFGYDTSSGRLSSIARGSGATYGLAPRQLQGLWVSPTTPSASRAQDVAVLTDPRSFRTTYTLDLTGRLKQELDPDGAVPLWERNAAGLPTVYVDGVGNTTLWAYTTPSNPLVQQIYDLVQANYADGGSIAYQYDGTFHKLTRRATDLGQVTSYAYDPATGDHTQTIDPTGATTTFSYYGGSQAGLLSQVLDPLGHPTTFAYDGNRRRSRATDALGQATTYAYDSAGNLRTVTDPLGHVSTTAYDARNRLTQSVAGDGGSTTYAYDAAGDQVGTTDQRGFRTTSVYDSRGWQTSVQEPQGRTTAFGRDAAGNAITVTDPNGHVTTFTFDPLGRELTRQQALNATDVALTTTTYDLAGNPTTVTDPLGHVTTTLYDRMNRATAVIDPLGDTTLTLYDTRGRQTARFDADGHGTFTAYDAADRVSTVTDGSGAVTTTLYDLAGNVTKTVDANGNATTFLYDAVNRPTATVDALNNRTTRTYDAAGRVTKVTDPLNRVTTFLYDNADRKTVVIDALNHRTTTVYDLAGNVTKTVDADGHATTFVYDGLNRRTAVTNALNQTTTTVYDPVGNVTAVIEPLYHTQTQSFTRTTTTVYDLANRPTEVIDPLGRHAYTAYDLAGNVIYRRDFRGKETDFQYDNANRQIWVRDPDLKITTYAYDAAGNRTGTTDPRGRSASTVYDGNNRPVGTTDYLDRSTVTSYDAAGNVILTVDERDKPTFYAYDALERRIAQTDALGNTTTTVFDAAGQATTTIDPRGFKTTYVYDVAGRQTNVIDPLGAKTTLAYDAANNRTTTTDPTGKTTTIAYDALNRPIAVTDPDNHTTTTVYDDAGRTTNRIDALNHTTTFVYDAADRKIAVSDGRGATTTTQYDSGDNVTSVQDADGFTTTYQYDDDGLKTAAIDPQGHTYTYQYDLDNRLSQTTDRLGRVRQMQYDDDGRLTQEVWLQGSTAVETLTYAYDEDGNLTQAGNHLGTATFSYDEDSRLSGTTDPFGRSLAFTLDEDGNRLAVTDSLGGVLESTYDGANRLTSRAFLEGASTQLSYNLAWTARGELAALQRFADAAGTQPLGASSYVYDPVSNLNTSITHYSGGTVALPFSGTALASFVYSYDSAQRLATEKDNGGATVTFQYDNANQVTADNVTSYAWDSAGNRTNAGFSQGSNKGDQLATDGTWNYGYDAEGNLTSKTKIGGGETWTFGYDYRNQMTQAVDQVPGGTTTLTYDYDPMGRLARRTLSASNTTVTVVYARDDKGNEWAELDGSAALTTRRFYTDRTDEAVVKLTYGASPTTNWYLLDRQGSVRGQMNNGGTLIGGLQTFDAFGNRVGGGSLLDRLGYTGRERDEYTGLQYNNHRWYDPATMRWISRDPIEFQAGDGNLYRYVGNDATNATDPSGEFGWIFGGLAVAALGWVVREAGDALLPAEWAEWTHAAGDIAIAGGLSVAAGPLAAGVLGGISGLFGATAATVAGVGLFGAGVWTTAQQASGYLQQGQQEGWSTARYVGAFGSLAASWLAPFALSKVSASYANELGEWFNWGQERGAAGSNWFNNLRPTGLVPVLETVGGRSWGGAAALQGGPGGLPPFNPVGLAMAARNGRGGGQGGAGDRKAPGAQAAEQAEAAPGGRELIHTTPGGRQIHAYDPAIGAEGVLVRAGGKGETPLVSGLIPQRYGERLCRL